jgi:twitching motility protein PilT
MEHIKPNTKLNAVLNWLKDAGASDFHFQEGKPARYRLKGVLKTFPADQVPPSQGEDFWQWFAENFTADTVARIRRDYEADLSVDMADVRWRVNFSKQQGRQSCSFRIVPRQSWTLKDLQLPPTLKEVSKEPRGLVLVTGPTGQGKSTTVRAMLQEINLTLAMRIVTIEDPIEFVFEDSQSQFEQREVGIDTRSFADGIRNAMRQDPNIIFVGEIRDRESIFAALQAAETGHLVFSTLHADSAAQAIARLREHYPAAEQNMITSLLARNLNMLICQRLIPSVYERQVPCLEIMKRDRTVQSAIQQNELNRLTDIIEVCTNQGMHSFDQYLTELLLAGVVSEEVAKTYAVNKHRLEMQLAGYQSSQSILLPEKR